MARTITEIKEGIVTDFMNNAEVAEAYGFNVGDSFSSHFSIVSLESILFHIFASASWVLEKLFYTHKKEVEERIEEILPHRPKWYRDLALNFMKGKELIPETDQYDTSEMTEDEITAAKVVKHAVAHEPKDASILTIKVKGENGKLDEETEEQLLEYIHQCRDAGVKINLVNKDGDIFNCIIDIYYNPMILPETVREDCREAIINYIENLPFNGEYTNVALIDILQEIEGVKIPEFIQATTSPSGSSAPITINARYTPEAGWFQAGDITLNMHVYE